MSAKKTADKPEDKARNKRLRNVAPALGAPSATRLLSVLSAVVAFVAVVALCRFLFPPVVEEAVADPTAAPAEQPVSSDETTEQPAGVADPWTASGTFSTGNDELDGKVKAFCDALTTEGLSATENAQRVYNTMMWGSYTDGSESAAPAGNSWDVAAAKQYLSKANVEAGEAGEGDVYDLAATTAFCLRYFGFGDAVAVPIISAAGTGDSSALVMVTDAYGYDRVCDPSLGADGWMADRYMYTIVVEDIGQDLAQFEALGLSVQKRDNGTEAQDTGAAGAEEEQTYDQGYDTSYDDQTYDQGYETGYDQGYDQGSDDYSQYDYDQGYDEYGQSDYGYGYDEYGNYVG